MNEKNKSKDKLNDLYKKVYEDMQEETFKNIFNTYDTFDNNISTVSNATESTKANFDELINILNKIKKEDEKLKEKYKISYRIANDLREHNNLNAIIDKLYIES